MDCKHMLHDLTQLHEADHSIATQSHVNMCAVHNHVGNVLDNNPDIALDVARQSLEVTDHQWIRRLTWKRTAIRMAKVCVALLVAGVLFMMATDPLSFQHDITTWDWSPTTWNLLLTIGGLTTIITSIAGMNTFDTTRHDLMVEQWLYRMQTVVERVAPPIVTHIDANVWTVIQHVVFTRNDQLTQWLIQADSDTLDIDNWVNAYYHAHAAEET